jgi:hypothetical protein
MPGVKIQKLAKANGFLALDLPDAKLAVGPTRLAPKILQDGAEMLARSVTYTFASFGLQRTSRPCAPATHVCSTTPSCSRAERSQPRPRPSMAVSRASTSRSWAAVS